MPSGEKYEKRNEEKKKNTKNRNKRKDQGKT
jgi:hypothetical protein